MGHDDTRAFGKVTTLPYTVARATYAVVPYYVWQLLHPSPNYRRNEVRRFYTESEAKGFNEMHSPAGILYTMLSKFNTTLAIFCGFALLAPILMMRRVFTDRRMRFFAASTPFWIAGMTIGVFIPHYFAQFTPAAYVLGLQAVRHLRQWKPSGLPAGGTFVRLTVVVGWRVGLQLLRHRRLQDHLGARYGDPSSNEELVRYYRDRDVWSVQPDVPHGMLTAYPATRRLDAALTSGQWPFSRCARGPLKGISRTTQSVLSCIRAAPPATTAPLTWMWRPRPRACRSAPPCAGSTPHPPRSQTIRGP
jgi:hypothetical protein